MEEDKNELLDRYLSGESMSDKQKERVEKWLHQDPELRNQARFLLQMHDWGRYQRQIVPTNQPQPSIFARPFAWVAAASIALVAGVGLWWYNQPSDVIQMANTQHQRSSIVPTVGNQTRLLKIAVYEKRDVTLGFAKSNQPSDSTFLMPLPIRAGYSPEYRFASYDTLRVRMSAKLLAKQWHLVIINGFDYQLVSNDSITYQLELGRELWLPLRPN